MPQAPCGRVQFDVATIAVFGLKNAILRRRARDRRGPGAAPIRRGRMTASIQRGAVVLRAERYGVVRDLRGGCLVIFPIDEGGERRAHDVELSFAELVAAGVALPRAVIRVGAPMLVACDGQATVGELAGNAVCRVSLAAIRAGRDALTDAIWSAERRHREAALSNRPVRMV